MSYYVVTGAAGFIGSRLVAGLNRRGISDVIAVDNLAHSDKFKNLAGCEIADYADHAHFIEGLERYEGAVTAVFHQGACSDTMETDGRYMLENNYTFSKRLLEWCQEEEVPFIYASSASVYGAGAEFREERRCEKPLNVYGYSKFLFDQHVRRLLEEKTSQIAGLRYFNVYGPNEQHKGRMASVAYHAYQQLLAGGKVKLFVGSGGYGNGEQKRDFVYVDDVVEAFLAAGMTDAVNGDVFNVGGSEPISHRDLVTLLIDVAGSGSVRFVEWPEEKKAIDIGSFYSDSSKFLAATGWQPTVDLREGLRRAVEFYRAHLVHYVEASA